MNVAFTIEKRALRNVPGPFSAPMRLRQMLAFNAALFRRLAAHEKKCDIQFKFVFDAMLELMTPLELMKKRHIGFAVTVDGGGK